VPEGFDSRNLLYLFVFSYILSRHPKPDSLPPPVSFSPPKAPPISAPEVPILY